MQSRILIVDAYGPNRTIYREWLSEIEGLEVMEAAAPDRALQLARDNEFALILVDVNLHSLDGWDLAARLADEAYGHAAPVVLLTSEVTEGAHVLRGYRAGAADVVLAAPTRGDVVLEKARVFVDLFERQDTMNQYVNELRSRLVSSVRQAEALRGQAILDPVTRLPNWVLFQDRLQSACARASRSHGAMAVGVLEIGGVESVSDRHGRFARDALLKAIAARLRRSVRATDTVGRLGDEFGVLLEGLANATFAEHVAAKIHGSLAEPFSLGSSRVVSPSKFVGDVTLGIAVYPQHARDVEELLVRARLARHAAKGEGGGVRLYSRELQAVPPRSADVPARAQRH